MWAKWATGWGVFTLVTLEIEQFQMLPKSRGRIAARLKWTMSLGKRVEGMPIEYIARRC